ncbi:four helix bundle protein [Fodinibius saliphilus]|nr:four helix bundle protein [Fodinibius saliphilus]
MATVERFEDLKIWKLARELVRLVYEVTNKDDF